MISVNVLLPVSSTQGSKDNVSAMLVKLPGAVLGPESNGGVDQIREKRTGYAMNDIDDTPAFTLTSAPNPSAAAAAALAAALRQAASENPNELEISADSAAFLEEVMRGIASDVALNAADLGDSDEEADDAAAIRALEASEAAEEASNQSAPVEEDNSPK